MKYEDFWSIYFTILRIFLIFYLTHSCIHLFKYHPSILSIRNCYLSPNVSHSYSERLLLRWYCWWGIWWVWLSSLGSGLTSLDGIHPVSSWTGCQHPASVSILPDSFIGILVSYLLVVVHPVCSLKVLVCCRGIPSPSAEARCPLIAIVICSGRRWLLDRDSYRDSVSRILDGGRWYEIWWRLLFTSLRAVWVCLMWYPDFSLIANLSGMSVGSVNLSVSLCQCHVSWLVKEFSPMKSNEVQR